MLTMLLSVAGVCQSCHALQSFMPVHNGTQYSLELPDKNNHFLLSFVRHAVSNETCGMCPWCLRPWPYMVDSKQLVGAEQQFASTLKIATDHGSDKSSNV